MIRSRLSAAWWAFLRQGTGISQEELERTLQDVEAKVRAQCSEGDLAPDWTRVYRVFSEIEPHDVRVVFLGQDPYPTRGHAVGLSFSVPVQLEPKRWPPSLKNMFKELPSGQSRRSGDLSDWLNQGVFLLNTTLTTEVGTAGAHRKLGWDTFTGWVLQSLARDVDPRVFVLMGRDAHRLGDQFADCTQHVWIRTTHPSPLGAHQSVQGALTFSGSQLFRRINEALQNQGYAPVRWGTQSQVVQSEISL